MSIEWIDQANFGTLSLSNCDREPIRIPGRIQQQGFMLIADPSSQGIVSLSANVPSLFGLSDWQDRELHLHHFFDAGELKRIERYCVTVAAAPNLDCFLKPIASQNYEVTAIQTDDHWCVEGILAPDSADNQAEISNTVASAITDFGLTSSVLEASEKAADLVQKISGYERVMVYQFDPQWNGVVIVENAQDKLENRFLHMHFPNTDIPLQARQLYLLNKTRVLMHVESESIPMVPETDPLNDEPFDMYLAHLRSVSPVHIEYLKNMGVQATLVISIIVDDQLWGMIACHHYDAEKRVSIATRRAAQCISDLLSSTISRLTAKEFNHAIERTKRIGEAIKANVSAPDGIHQALTKHSAEIQALFGAQGIGWKIGDEIFSEGLSLSSRGINTAQKLSKDGVLIYNALPEVMEGESEDANIGGIVLLAANNDFSEYLYVTRCIALKTIPWGGEPDTMLKVAADSDTDAVLTPRKSFEIWEESIRGRSIEFQLLHFQIANMLRHDIIEATLANQRLRHARTIAEHQKYSRTTRLLNHNGLVEHLEGLVTEDPDTSFAIALVDIDNFGHAVKRIGRSATDQLILQVAHNLEAHAGNSELAHTGVDQFAVVACPAPAPDALRELANELQIAASGAYMVEEDILHITISTAYAVYPSDARSAAETLTRAELALDQAKQQGLGQVRGFETALLEQEQQEQSYEENLRNALTDGSVSHYFQPIIDCRSGRMVGGEALMRWEDSKGTVHGAKELIPSLIKMDLLADVDRELIEARLASLDSLLKIRPDFFISFNLGGSIFQRKNKPLLDDLLATLSHHAENIVFEVTESNFLELPQESIQSITAMCADGFRVVLDDFGTGQSSLVFLKDFPISGVKIDNQFIQDIDQQKTAKLVESMQHIATSLDLTTISEGVETRSQAVKLNAKGCHLHQGNYYFRPMPWEQFRKTVQAHRKT